MAEKINSTENKEEKVVALPINPINPKDKYVTVCINGEETKIERGKQQKVSKDVYERLVISGYVIEG